MKKIWKYICSLFYILGYTGSFDMQIIEKLWKKPRTCGRFRRGLQIPMTDELTDWRFLYPGEYAVRWTTTKKSLSNPGNFHSEFHFEKEPVARPFEKNIRSPMEKGQIEFSIIFHQQVWNSTQNDNDQITCIF